MLRIGLTGGIGAGKSTGAAAPAPPGAVVGGAHRLAPGGVGPRPPRPGAGVAALGPRGPTADGALDRPALAAVVFADPEARRRLDGVVHPLVRRRAAELELAAREADEDAVVVHDLP